MKYEIKFASKFKKDIKVFKGQEGKLDKIFKTIEKLARGEILDAKYKDHPLLGDYLGARECHIEPDLLLIYQIKKDVLVLNVLRLGSHAKLFE